MAIDAQPMAERQGDLGQLYLAVIQRYKDYIEEQESLSVASNR